MLEGIDINQRIEFISSCDITEPKTIFVFRPLGGVEMMRYQELNKPEVLLEFLNTTIVDIKNCNNPDKIAYIKSIDKNAISEIVIKALSINELTGEDKKKL